MIFIRYTEKPYKNHSFRVGRLVLSYTYVIQHGPLQGIDPKEGFGRMEYAVFGMRQLQKISYSGGSR